MESKVTTKERRFKYEFSEKEMCVLYAMVNMNDRKLEDWIKRQAVYENV